MRPQAQKRPELVPSEHLRDRSSVVEPCDDNGRRPPRIVATADTRVEDSVQAKALGEVGTGQGLLPSRGPRIFLRSEIGKGVASPDVFVVLGRSARRREVVRLDCPTRARISDKSLIRREVHRTSPADTPMATGIACNRVALGFLGPAEVVLVLRRAVEVTGTCVHPGGVRGEIAEDPRLVERIGAGGNRLSPEGGDRPRRWHFAQSVHVLLEPDLDEQMEAIARS